MISGYEILARATFTCTPTDADTGRLDVVPDAPAYGTKLRWSAPKLIAAANERAPGANVHTLHVYAARPREGRPRPPRRTPQDGYRGALEAAPPRRVDPGTAEAVGRQTRAMRELSQRAFPESGTSSDHQPTPIEATRALALRRGGTRRPGGRGGGRRAAVRCAANHGVIGAAVVKSPSGGLARVRLCGQGRPTV
ncbi:DUF721 domain-containing protein [Streptomyces sp. NPDC057557]|uniref:DUF721 domain-containing protein n=1 Tax=Streptomyces sp. NPDC057557 TaxID=3346167 RepID=UPI003688CCF2